jgi:hypothetical protein
MELIVEVSAGGWEFNETCGGIPVRSSVKKDHFHKMGQQDLPITEFYWLRNGIVTLNINY